MMHFDFVRANLEISEPKAPLSICIRTAGQVRAGLTRGDLGAFDYGATCIRDAPADARGICGFLRRRYLRNQE
jgi:hypothetical protein